MTTLQKHKSLFKTVVAFLLFIEPLLGIPKSGRVKKSQKKMEAKIPVARFFKNFLRYV